MTTRCRTIQLLEPEAPTNLEITDDDNSLAVEEGGALALTIGVTEYDVLFTQQKLSADYDFIERDIVNEEDGSDQLAIEADRMTNRTVNGFTLSLDAQPDTANYIWNWRVKVTAL